LAQLRKEHPLLQVELMAQSQFPSLVTREVEVLVTLDRPEVGRYVVTKLVDINYYFYAARSYLDVHPPIRSLVDLEGHQFVDYVHEPSMSQRLRYLEDVVPNANRSFTCTSILAQRDAAAAGLGIVLLTPYCVIDRPELAQVLPGQSQVTRTFWLAAPEDLYRIKRVRVIFDFLRSLVEKEPTLFTLNEPQHS
jgi:DNA-binding transcriptional LysR family regulator